MTKIKKELKKSNERKEELLKEVEILKVANAQIEADKNKMTKMYEMLEEALDTKKKEDEEPAKVNIKCREFEKASCTYKERCKFVHPTNICEEFKKTGQCSKKYCLELHNSKGNKSNTSQQDCRFWVEGDCRFDDGECRRGAHIKEKFGIKKREPTKMEAMLETLIRQQSSSSSLPMNQMRMNNSMLHMNPNQNQMNMSTTQNQMNLNRTQNQMNMNTSQGQRNMNINSNTMLDLQQKQQLIQQQMDLLQQKTALEMQQQQLGFGQQQQLLGFGTEQLQPPQSYGGYQQQLQGQSGAEMMDTGKFGVSTRFGQ